MHRAGDVDEGDTMLDQNRDDTLTSTALPFENADWRVLEDGLEHRATGYFIERDVMARRRGTLWEWPLHLSEKSWCSGRSFREAFMAGLSAFDLPSDAELARSFVVAFGRVVLATAQTEQDEFISLGALVRPKSADLAPIRRRSAGSESRTALVRRSAIPVSQRADDTTRQRATN